LIIYLKKKSLGTALNEDKLSFLTGILKTAPHG